MVHTGSTNKLLSCFFARKEKLWRFNHTQSFFANLGEFGCWNILGDPGADSGDEGKSKRAEKYGTKKSKERREEPLGTMSYQTSSNGRRRSGFWLVPENLSFSVLRWLTPAKNAIVGWLLNFGIHMFVKSAILIILRSTVYKKTHYFFPQEEKYSVLRFSSWYFSLT